VIEIERSGARYRFLFTRVEVGLETSVEPPVGVELMLDADRDVSSCVRRAPTHLVVVHEEEPLPLHV